MLLVTLLAISCADDDRQAADAIPDGYGKLTITISTPEAAKTRAVSTSEPWLQGTTDERAIKSYHLLVCNGTTIMQAISGGETELGDHDNANNYFPSTGTITTDILPVGTYNFTFYCLANFTSEMLTATGLTISNGKVTDTELPANFETKVMQPIANGIVAVPTRGLPMTGKLTQNSVSIARRTTTTINDPIILWRMMAKLEFDFTNETSQQVNILGIEVEPINQATAANSGVYLISQDNLSSINDLVPLFPSGATKSASATWALDAAPTQGVAASVSMGGVFASTALSWGSKVSVPTENPTMQTYDRTYTLRKFSVNNNTSSRDNEAVITLKVTPAAGMSFTPKNISFKACRGATDGGKFDVEAGNATLATGVTPPRYNGTGGSSGLQEPPFYKEYSYAISGTATTGEYTVKIYLYNLNNKEYGFRDIVISGDVTNNTGSTLQEYITLPSAALTDVGAVSYEPSTAKTITANGGTGALFFYVNETDATFTTTENQFSVRFKIQRQNGSGWYDDEIRFGLTTPYIDGNTGGNGFNVIRRNDWIHIPVHIRDWQFRIEPVAFVPIAGYPATMLSSDALTATFSTGGYIILQPFAQKNNDGTWRDFSDSEVTFVSMTATGDTQMFDSAPAYDATTQRITGIIKNNLNTGTYKTTLTVKVKLGPSGSQQDYSFTCNVVLQK